MKHADTAWATRRRPGLGMLVAGVHVLLVVALWQNLHTKVVEVPAERHALLWVDTRPAAPAARSPTPPTAAARPRRAPPVTAPAPAAAAHESTWVEPAPPLAAAPPANAPSAPLAERLLDSTATRAAIRQAGRQPLLQERAAQAMGDEIQRTDTALARGAAEAGLPDCMKDGKAAAGQIGPIALGGILGLPFLAARVATGRCAK